MRSEVLKVAEEQARARTPTASTPRPASTLVIGSVATSTAQPSSRSAATGRLVAAHCAAVGVPYTQATLWQFYVQVTRYLNAVGLENRDPFLCPLVAQRRGARGPNQGNDYCVSVQTWHPDDPGVLVLPSGRLVRGRGLRHDETSSAAPEFGLYLGRHPLRMSWPSRWLPWRDWWLPTDRYEAQRAFLELWARAATERVEVACRGGRGRTGTALACVAVLDGVPPKAAVAYVRRHYHRHAVEMLWQQRYVKHWQG